MIILNNRIQKIALSTIFAFICFLTFVSLNTSTKAQSQEIIFPLASIVDGDLIKTSDNPDVYIVKIVSGNSYRRLIINPAVFESYDNLDWDDVKTVQSSTMNSFTVSSLVKEVNSSGEAVDGKVYMLFPVGDNGTKRHIKLTHAQFLEGGGSDNAVYNINSTEASDSFYATGTPITTVQDLRTLLPSNTRATVPNNNPPTAINTINIRSIRSDNNDNNQQSNVDTRTQDPPSQDPPQQNAPQQNAPQQNVELNFRAVGRGTYGVFFRWNVIANAEGYVLKYCKGGVGACSPTSTWNTKNVPSSVESNDQGVFYDLKGLSPDREYNFTLAVILGGTASVDSSPVVARTLMRSPSLKFQTPTANSIPISWDAIPGATFYTFTACKKPTKENTCTGYVIKNQSSTTSVTFAGLDPNSVYQFRTRSRESETNYDRMSGSAYRVFAATKFLPPTNIRAGSTKATSIKLQWDSIPMSDEYELRRCEGANCTPNELTRVANPDAGINRPEKLSQTVTHEITGLSPRTTYRFTIKTKMNPSETLRSGARITIANAADSVESAPVSITTRAS